MTFLGVSRVTFLIFCHGLDLLSRVTFWQNCHGISHGLLWPLELSRVTRCVTGYFFGNCHGLLFFCHVEKKNTRYMATMCPAVADRTKDEGAMGLGKLQPCRHRMKGQHPVPWCVWELLGWVMRIGSNFVWKL